MAASETARELPKVIIYYSCKNYIRVGCKKCISVLEVKRWTIKCCSKSVVKTETSVEFCYCEKYVKPRPGTIITKAENETG